MILCVCPNPSVDTSWELETDSTRPGSTIRVSRERRYPGGKATHVALALRELGADVLLMGIWAGENGGFIQAACQGYGLATAGISLDEENSCHSSGNRSCYTISSPDPYWNHTEFLGSGPVVGAQDYKRYLDTYTTIISEQDIDFIVLAGSWPPLTEVAGGQLTYDKDPYGPFIDAANLHGVRVWLDCAGDHLAAALGIAQEEISGKIQRRSPNRRVFGLHINQAELEGLAAILTFDGAGIDQSALTKRLENEIKEELGPAPSADATQTMELQQVIEGLRQKTELLALTKGVKGLFLYQDGKCVHASVDLVKLPVHKKSGEKYRMYSTVGCGDCLLAGLAYTTSSMSPAGLTDVVQKTEEEFREKLALNDSPVQADLYPSSQDTVSSLLDVAKYGAAAGAANILRKEIGMLYRSDVIALLEQTRIHQLL